MWKALISLRWIKSVISTCRHKPAPIAANCWTTTKGGAEVPPLVVAGLRWITAWFLDVGQSTGILAGGVLGLTHGLIQRRIAGLGDIVLIDAQGRFFAGIDGRARQMPW